MKPSSQYGIVLLAAGKSTRLGQPKQLLKFEENTLVKRAAMMALEICDTVIVVTGAESKKTEEELSGLEVTTIFNNDYEEGLGSSIRTGMMAMQENFPQIEAVIFMVCDQPYISSSLLRQLIEQSEDTKKGIVACFYKNAYGTPVLFRQKYFSLLLDLKGDHGAKKIIQSNLDDVAGINFPDGAIDIDTKEDYESLRSSNI